MSLAQEPAAVCLTYRFFESVIDDPSGADFLSDSNMDLVDIIDLNTNTAADTSNLDGDLQCNKQFEDTGLTDAGFSRRVLGAKKAFILPGADSAAAAGMIVDNSRLFAVQGRARRAVATSDVNTGIDANAMTLIAMAISVPVNPFGITGVTQPVEVQAAIDSLLKVSQQLEAGFVSPETRKLIDGLIFLARRFNITIGDIKPSVSLQAPTPLPKPSGSKLNLGIIVGATVGGIVGAILVGLVCWYFVLARSLKKQEEQLPADAAASGDLYGSAEYYDDDNGAGAGQEGYATKGTDEVRDGEEVDGEEDGEEYEDEEDNSQQANATTAVVPSVAVNVAGRA